MRKKDNATTTSFDVTAGIDFADTSETEIPSIQPVGKNQFLSPLRLIRTEYIRLDIIQLRRLVQMVGM